MKEKIKLLVLVWTVGLLVGGLVWLLVILRIIKVNGYRADKFSSKNKGLILLSNHPSLTEPAILPFLFLFSSKSYLFHLDKVPQSTPDKENYYDKPWFSFLRPVCVPIERGNGMEELRAIDGMREIAENGGVLILFGEGTRTFKGTKKRGAVYSPSGKKIARFPLGMRRLFRGLNCKILPIWTEGGERIIPNEWDFPDIWKFLVAPFRLLKGMRITIGEPFDSENLPRTKEEVVGYLVSRLISLADKKN